MASDCSGFEKTVKSCLAESGPSGLLDLLSGSLSEKKIREDGCQLFGLVFGYIKDNAVEDARLSEYGQVLDHIAKNSNSKDIYLTVLEHFDPMVELKLILVLFPALITLCRQLLDMDKQNHCFNLGLLFSSLVYYGESLNIPNYVNYEPDDEYNPVLEELNISRYLFECVTIGELVVKDIISQCEEKLIHEAHAKAAKDEVMILCCGLMERLSVLDLHVRVETDEKQLEESNSEETDARTILSSLTPKSTKLATQLADSFASAILSVKAGEVVFESSYEAAQVAKQIVSLTLTLHSSWVLLQDLTWKSFVDTGRSMSDEECDKTDQARACFLYLTLVEGCGDAPQVVDPYYAFCRCIPSVLKLMNSENPKVIHKGLELCRFVSNRLRPLTLHCGELSEKLKYSRVRKPALSLLQAAVTIATQCASKTLRQRAAQFLTRFVDKFVWLDRHILLHHLLTTVEHYGVVGYMIVYLKDKLSEILQDPPPPECEVFLRNENLGKLLDVCFELSNGSETDLISEYDKIMATLNLLRFLLIRDSKNKTGILTRASDCDIEGTYLNFLRSDINLSRMHFMDELKKQSTSKQESEASPGFTINDVSLPSIPRKSRIKMLESAIHSFDMMQTVCARVQELLDERCVSV